MSELTSYHRAAYRQWAGNPRGFKASPERCATEVWLANGWGSSQCARKRGHGPEGAFCKQHAKKYAGAEVGK